MPPTTLSRPFSNVWQITLTSPPDNRLTPDLLSSFSSNLDDIEAEWRKTSGSRDTKPGSSKDKWGEHGGSGAVIITGQERFFSNGLDYENSIKIKDFFETLFDPFIVRLLTFPLVTVAALNGHAFAGGMLVAMACDFRIMTSGKGMLSMNEIQFGAPMPNSFAALLKLKFTHPADLRDTLLAKRWTQAELLDRKLIDEIVAPDQLMTRAVAVAKREGAKVGSGVWGPMKDTLYHEVKDASQSRRKLYFSHQEAKEFWKRYEGSARAKL